MTAAKLSGREFTVSQERTQHEIATGMKLAIVEKDNCK